MSSLVGLAIVGKKNEPLYLCDCCSLVSRDENQGGRGNQATDHDEDEEVEDAAHDETSHHDDESHEDEDEEEEDGSNENNGSEEDKEGDEDEAGDEEEQEEEEADPYEDATEFDDELAKEDPFGFFESTQRRGMSESLTNEHRFMMHSALDQLSESIETTGAGLPVPKGRTGSWLGRLVCIDEELVVFGRISATSIKLLALTGSSARDQDVRVFLDEVHASHMQYMMNPFTKLKEPIRSKEFDKRIKRAVQAYESKQTYEC